MVAGNDPRVLPRRALEPLGGWGRLPVEPCRVRRPRDREALLAQLREERSVIPRGLGRAYGDAALNRDRGVSIQTAFDRFASFDPEQGVVDCEAGVSIAEIAETFLPRGWMLPTTPGTGYVTLGGAIAADVHGKNHHVDGSFGACVESLDLLVASGEELTVSPSRDPELFWATVGGMGLTGIIRRARLRLRRVGSAWFAVDHRASRDLDATLEAIEATNARYRYSVAWLDGAARGRSLGRSVLMLADDPDPETLPRRLRSRPLERPPRARRALPFDLPTFALNGASIRAFNALYVATRPAGRRWVHHDAFFHPLDALEDWNRVYGRRGFAQYQAFFPRRTARAGLVALMDAVAASKRPAYLGVLKASGPRGRGVLSYLDEGYTLALDFANSGADLEGFFHGLDALLLRFGGRLYLAKDAFMTAETFAAMYPEAAAFRALKARVDPEQRFGSSLARRVGLVAA